MATIKQMTQQIRKLGVPYRVVAKASGLSIALVNNLMSQGHENLTLKSVEKLSKAIAALEKRATRKAITTAKPKTAPHSSHPEAQEAAK